MRDSLFTFGTNQNHLSKLTFMKNWKTVLSFALFLAILPSLLFSQEKIQNTSTTKTQKADEVPDQANDPWDGSIFKVVETPPSFPGCESIRDKATKKKCAEEKMMDFLYSNLYYPKEAYDNGVEGMVVASFIVEKDGKIIGAKIVRDIGAGCGREALNVINAMPDWEPGKQRGKPVRVQFNLPIRFTKEKNIKVRESATPNSPPVDEFPAPPLPPSPKKESSTGFKKIDENPRFPACEDKKRMDKAERKQCADIEMLKFIYSNLKYPAMARKKKIEGMVVISYYIEADGSISEAKVKRDIGGGCGEEALRLVNSMPKWIPAKSNGEPVRAQFNLPVKFKLE